MVFLSFDCTRHIFNLILANIYGIAIKDFVSLKIPAEILCISWRKIFSIPKQADSLKEGLKLIIKAKFVGFLIDLSCTLF